VVMKYRDNLKEGQDSVGYLLNRGEIEELKMKLNGSIPDDPIT